MHLVASLSFISIATAQSWTVGQVVDTVSGKVKGHASGWKPQVSEYLGIPYAQPPVGQLRFAAPKLLRSTSAVNATKFGPSCPQNIAGTLARDNEDCLTLNIWSKPQTGSKSKAVMIWIYGGGFGSGTSYSAIYNGARLADEHDVVVASINYRVNIFGFPRAPFLQDLNPGLLDQRLGVEWLRDNVAKFGGDPNRMILFGQSAGGGSVDMYTFAWPKDPIVKGFISESGVASNPRGPPANTSAGWWITSQKIGCGGIEAGEATLACMRTKRWQDIANAIPKRGVTANLGAGNFGPTKDGKVVFPDYADRRKAGNFARLPYLVGNTNYERGFYENLAKARGEKLDPNFRPPAKDGCGSNVAADAHIKAGVKAWRYLYAGQFDGSSSPGAGHGAEIALVFGTIENPPRRANSAAEQQLSLKLRTAWTDFAKDPVNGLSRLGWPVYDAAKPTVIRIGSKGSSEIVFESRAKYDSCS